MWNFSDWDDRFNPHMFHRVIFQLPHKLLSELDPFIAGFDLFRAFVENGKNAEELRMYPFKMGLHREWAV